MKTRAYIVSLAIGLHIALLAPMTISQAATGKTRELPVFHIDESKLPVPDLTLPVPVKIVHPQVRISQTGQDAYMLFTIKVNGSTSNVRYRGSAFNVNDLEAGLMQAIRGWKFEPAKDKSGNPVTVEIGLWMKVVRKENNQTAFAAITFSKLEFIKLG